MMISLPGFKSKFYITQVFLLSAVLYLLLIVNVFANDGHDQCANPDGVTLQILGSGGPIADDGRASTGYLVWINGHSRILIDVGGGIFLRFSQSGGRFEDLDHIAISHLHTDHSVDLAGLLKSGYFSSRTRSLSISGPNAGEPYPDIETYLRRLLDPQKGAYAYLGGYLDGSDGLVKLVPQVIDSNLQKQTRVDVQASDKFKMFALGVPHGPVPALAYKIRIRHKTIVFAGDQNGSAESFVDFARGADILVMHMAVPENIGRVGRNLHAPPSIIAKIAVSTGADKLVLSHFMARSLRTMKNNLVKIRAVYHGTVIRANDLDCIDL